MRGHFSRCAHAAAANGLIKAAAANGPDAARGTIMACGLVREVPCAAASSVNAAAAIVSQCCSRFIYPRP
ncbi:UNVERIFIED_CONTAM: hypothetical protein Sradi_6848300 [Sesamum radiatum]|uniref:Uncharacterized protein n=1 Tax=Sesamum radiatum TaxID=300843 RepID=A0AAW2JL78_SESRA